jgi:hypothetical protein
MRLCYRSNNRFESWICVPCAASDPHIDLEHEERHNSASWPLSSAFRYWALRLRRDGVLRLCDWCLKRRRRCHDSRRPHTFKNWKTYRRRQWAVEQ